MSSECETMRELHAIRERISEEIKDMTPEEAAALINKRAEETMTELGIPMKRPEPTPALQR